MPPKKQSINVEICETKGTNKTIEETYTKYTDREHVLNRPDAYVGSITLKSEYMFIYDDNLDRIIRKQIDYVPGLYKIFDEILVNARDQSELDKTCNTISVSIDRGNNTISVYNNGKGIDVVEHKEYNKYIPELLFGELRTSSNYNDTEQKTTGGRNGFGAKLTNIFSTKFVVDTVDHKRKKRFYQEYYNNMSSCSKAVIQDIQDSSGYTKITFTFDYEKFGLLNLTEDIYGLFKKRVYDLAGVTNKCKIYFNDTLIECKDFKTYCNLYLFDGMNENDDENDDENAPSESSNAPKSMDEPFKLFYEKANERWSIGFMYAPDFGYTQISFVNGICTYHGGSHVDYVVGTIINKLKEDVMKTHKDLKLGRKQMQDMKDNMIVFVNCTINNPAFTSQVKDILCSEVKDFGSTCVIKDATLNKFAKAGIMNQISDMIKLKEQLILKKTDGKKVLRIKNLPKLEDANKAGGVLSDKCILIITEGDSAKTLAMSGRGPNGCDYIGIFPIKGKLMNVRDASTNSLLENEEITNLKKIIGLEHGKKYDNVNGLRYGKIVIMSDQDVDGFHIKGLIINFIHTFWPSLLKIRGFITSLATPIVKVSKGNEIIPFYNLIQLKQWKETAIGKWQYKYYKGLGTSNDEDAKEYFDNFYEKLINYIDDSLLDEDDINNNLDENITNIVDVVNIEQHNEQYNNQQIVEKHGNIKCKYKNKCREAITLGFEKSRANDRKSWLKNYNREIYLDNNQKIVTIPEFINKELLLFSHEDVERSIPSLCDGMKPSTRKILYAAFLKNLSDKSKEIKVSQFTGFVAEKAEYHHGEASINSAIIGMAQNFVGTNNINLLHPSGQFGSRILGGKDSAAPRYIFTYLEELTRLIFNPLDDNILDYLVEDGIQIEPKYYLPIIPIILVNGSTGIGTGYSTNIPCYNPSDIITNMKQIIADNNYIVDIKPWYNNFKGNIIEDINTKGKYLTYGTLIKIDNTKVRITELPIGLWTTKYRGILDKLELKKVIKSYNTFNTPKDINIVVEFDEEYLTKILTNHTIYSILKLSSSVHTRNMYAFSQNDKITHYHNINAIMHEFYKVRHDGYIKRKKYIIDTMTKEKDMLLYKIKFITAIINNQLIISKKKESVFIDELEKNKYMKFKHPESDSKESYNYLLSMSLLSLTEEKITELQKKYDDKIQELGKINALSEKDMWLNDLNELEIAYNKWIIKTQYNIEDVKISDKKKSKK